MKKNIVSILIMIILSIAIFQLLALSEKILEAVGFSFTIWKGNIFPTLFPFFVFSEILVNYGFVDFISELFKPIMYKLFKVNGSAAYVFFMGMISGFPSSAKYVRELYNQKIIDASSGTKILMFTHFSNPLFIIGTIATAFLNNKNIGILILICHYASNIIIGLLLRNYYPSKNENIVFSLKNSINLMTQHRLTNQKSLGKIIGDSIINSINTLLLILGTITMFLIVTTIIDQNLELTSLHQAILNGSIEMTQGLKYISILNVPLKFKTIISTIFISFGGLSVHMQIISILSDTKIKYLPFLFARIIHAAISGILIYLLFDCWIVLF